MWLFRINIIFLLLLSLPGCGFRPMYISYHTQSLQKDIYVASIPNRRGQMLQQELIQKLDGSKTSSGLHRYRLNITYEESSLTLATTKENTEGRNEVSAIAKFDLYDNELQKIIFQSQAISHTSYSIGTQVVFSAYSSIVSEQSVREKLIPHLAEDITQQLHVFFQNQECRQSS